MSHVVAGKQEVKDLDCFEQACKNLGLTFVRNQKTFEWFGQWMNDYAAKDAAYNLGIDPNQYGKCEHAVKVPGSSYEIGLIRNNEGRLLPVFDFWGSNGRAIQDRVGQTANLLMQEYALVTGERVAKSRGLNTERIRMDDRIRLRVTGSRI